MIGSSARLRTARPISPFVRLWLARLVSSAGSEVSSVALPLVAVVSLGSSAFDVALLTAAGYVPSVLFGLWAGAIADRFDRRLLVVGADVIRGAVLLAIPIGWMFGWLSAPALVVVAFLVGCGTLMFDVALQALTPSLLSPVDLVKGNARLQLAEQGAGLVGPAAGGGLVAALTAPIAVVVDAVSYVASAALLVGLPPALPHGKQFAEAGQASEDGRQILVGLRFVVAQPLLRATAMASFLVNLGGRAIEALLVVALVRVGGLGPAGVGLVFSTGAVGFAIGALITDRVADRFGLGPSITGGLAVVVLALGLMALAPASAFGLVVALAFALYGVAALVFSVGGLSLRQAVTPAPLLGRVSAAVRMAVYAAFPLGAIAGGTIATLIDIRTAMTLAATVSLLGLLVIAISPVPRVRRLATVAVSHDGG